jgi:integrase/recombinase XerD
MDVSGAVVDYLADIKHLSKNTQEGYRQRLMCFAAWCSDAGVSLEQVNNKAVQRFLDWLRTNRKPRKPGKEELSTYTTAGYVRAIWALLHWCLEDDEYSEFVTFAKVKAIKMPRLEQVIKDVFTDEEIEALFAACQHLEKGHEYQLRDRAILSVLVDTGIRSAELRTLQIGNIHLDADDSFIVVHGKNNKWRECPLGNRARRAIARYMRQYRKDAAKGEPVFMSRHGGPLSHEALKTILLRLKALSTLPDDCTVNPHKFRHSYATRFIASGGDLFDLSKLLGHSSIVITQEYIKSLGASQIRKRKDRPSVLDSLKSL